MKNNKPKQPQQPEVTLIIGAPGSGKSWITSQTQDTHTTVPHDTHQTTRYAQDVAAQAKTSTKPVIAEAPFRASIIKQQLQAEGITVHEIYITETDATIQQRYEQREHKPIPKQHLTNNKKYTERSTSQQGDFSGTSSEVLNYLQNKNKDTKHA